MKSVAYDAVIVANGDCPRTNGAPADELRKARHIVACDGAAVKIYRRLGISAEYAVGDFDSLGNRSVAAKCVRIAGQDDNDLMKAIRFCRRRGWKRLLIVGATGRREDHALGNVFRAMAEGIPVMSDYGSFIPFVKEISIELKRGTPISVFATSPDTRMVSAGLEWALDDVRFENLYCATLNRVSVSGRVEIRSSRPAFVYVARKR